MRKIIPCIASSRNARTFSKLTPYLLSINPTKTLTRIPTNLYGLTNQPRFYMSSDQQVQVENKLIVPYKGYLTIRNSEYMDLAFDTSGKIINVLIPKSSTIDDAKELIKEKLSATDAQFLCDQTRMISGFTPLEALLDRNSFLILNNDYSVKVEGELLRPVVPNEQNEAFRNLELPLVTRREIQGYCKRINTWIEAKYGGGFQNSTVKIPKAEAKKILVQALLDPLESNRRLLEKEEEFQNLYWQVQELLDKKSQAVVECSKMVRARMSLGVFLIMGNVAFIWAGTYIYYSWDIIEPIAYFISSIAGIVLCSRFFKIKRPFSLQNYKQYMLEKYMPAATRKVGLDLLELESKKIQLAELEAEIKDYYLKRL